MANKLLNTVPLDGATNFWHLSENKTRSIRKWIHFEGITRKRDVLQLIQEITKQYFLTGYTKQRKRWKFDYREAAEADQDWKLLLSFRTSRPPLLIFVDLQLVVPIICSGEMLQDLTVQII